MAVAAGAGVAVAAGAGGGLVVVLRSLRNISVLSIGEGYCYGIVIYDAATCFRRRRGVAVLICFSLSY